MFCHKRGAGQTFERKREMQIKFHHLIVTLIFFLALSPCLFAQSTLLLGNNLTKYPLGRHLEILEDKSGQLSYADIRAPEMEKRWYKSEHEVLNFAFSDSAYWLRVIAKSPEQKKMLLVLSFPHGDYIDAYIENGAGDVNITRTGDRRPFNSRQKRHHHFLFDVNLPANQPVAIYLRIASYDGFHEVVPLTLWSYEAFLEENTILHYFLGILLGVTLIMAVYNFFIFLSLRDTSYLYYVLFLLGFILFLIIYHGFAFLLFWPDSPYWANLSHLLSTGFFSIQLLLFTQSYLDTPRNAPRLNKLLYIPGIFLVIFIAYALGGSYAFGQYFLYPGVIIGLIMTTAAGFICLKQGHRPARYFLFTFLIAFCGVIPFALKIFGLAPSNFFTENSVLIGLILMMLFLSLGLTERINVMRERYNTSREYAFQLQKEAARNLELKVEERTRELALANDKLQEADRAKTHFFTNISHEFRTPLTLILAPIESIIRGDYGGSLDIKSSILKSILQNSLRLLRLINNLLDFTKIAAGKMSARKQKTDMGALLKYYKSSVQSAVESKGLKIDFIDNSGGIFAWLDKDLMEKAIMNLLSNAFKFTPAGGTILVELDQNDEEHFTLSVEDTGVGIPEDKLERIFERFNTVDKAAPQEHEGTGIGLSLTKEIIELHGGQITAQNRPGQGAIFKIRMPVDALISTDGPERSGDFSGATQDENKENLREVKPYLLADLREDEADGEQTSEIDSPGMEGEINTGKHDRRRILIVEDNSDMRSFIKTLLERNYNLQIVTNGREGLEQALETKPDLILSDVMMPEMDGYTMTQKIKSSPETRDIPVILLSARADVTNRLEGLELGADDYLSKPFNSEELLSRIRNQLNS